MYFDDLTNEFYKKRARTRAAQPVEVKRKEK